MLVALLGAIRTPPTAQAATASTPTSPFHYSNGYLVRGPFLAFYQANGGTAAFGEPETDAFIEAGGLTVQYFTFARFEWHGDHVELTHLGRAAAEKHAGTAPFAWLAPDAVLSPERTYLPESGHTIGGAFAWYWESHGGVSVLGFPISEEFAEVQTDGSSRLTQYFERAVLTYISERAAADGGVDRAPLGTLSAPERPTLPAPEILATSRLSFRPGSADGHNIAVAGERLNGRTLEPGERLSFLQVVGPVTEKNGYVGGPGISNGQIVTDMIGGGICTVSTLLYRTAWHAGIPILERRGHSFWLKMYANEPGVEAAVTDPGLDLVIQNDTLGPMMIEVLVTSDTIIVQLWGFPDGRIVLLGDAEVRSTYALAAARGAAIPAFNPQEQGATVVTTRTIKLPKKPTRTERVVTIYKPLPPRDNANTETSS